MTPPVAVRLEHLFPYIGYRQINFLLLEMCDVKFQADFPFLRLARAYSDRESEQVLKSCTYRDTRFPSSIELRSNAHRGLSSWLQAKIANSYVIVATSILRRQQLPPHRPICNPGFSKSSCTCRGIFFLTSTSNSFHRSHGFPRKVLTDFVPLVPSNAERCLRTAAASDGSPPAACSNGVDEHCGLERLHSSDAVHSSIAIKVHFHPPFSS